MDKDIRDILEIHSLIWEEYGLCKVQGEKRELVSNFLPIVITCYRDLVTGDYMFDIQVWVAGDSTPVICEHISMNQLEHKDWHQVFGDRCILMAYKGSCLKKLIVYQMSRLECVPIIIKQGWFLLNDSWYYNYGNRVFGRTIIPGLNMDETAEDQRNAISREDLCVLIKQLLKCGGSSVYVTFLTALYSVLRKMFVQAGVDHMYTLYISGASATFKTTLARYFTVWDINSSEQPVLSLESTYRSLEKGVMQFADCMVLLDDLAPMEQRSANRARNDQVAGIIRGTFNRLERNKYSGNGGVASGIDASLVITAEHLIGVESVLTRSWLLSTDSGRTPVTESFLNFKQEHPLLIQEFIPVFIQWVVGEQDIIINFIVEKWGEYRETISVDNVANIRVADTYRVLKVVQDIFMRFYQDISGKEHCKKFIKKVDKYLEFAYSQNLRILDEERESRADRGIEYKVLRAVCKILNDKNFIWIEKNIPYISGDGYRTGHYLFPDVKRLWRRMINLPGLENLSVNKMSKILAAHRLLVRGKGKDLQVDKYGHSCYKLDPDVLEELSEMLLDSEE